MRSSFTALNPLHNRVITLPVILSFHLLLGLSGGFFRLVFPSRVSYRFAFIVSPVRATCPGLLVSLCVMTLIFHEQYKP